MLMRADVVAGEELIDGYAGLVLALKTRRESLGMTQLGLDAAANFPDGMSGKLEGNLSSPSNRRAGDKTLRRWLRALGLRLRLVEVADIRPEAPRVFRHVVHKRAPASMTSPVALPVEPIPIRPHLKNLRPQNRKGEAPGSTQPSPFTMGVLDDDG